MSFTIEIDPPLSDRPLKYGRNVMWLSSVILVLAYVPYVELNKFQPLGFDLSEGGEIAIWGILGAVLIYYALQFYVAGGLDFRVWYHGNSPVFGLTVPLPVSAKTGGIEPRKKIRGQRIRVFLRFLILDLAFPTVLLVFAINACGSKFLALLCDLQLCQSLPRFVALVCSSDMPNLSQ